MYPLVHGAGTREFTLPVMRTMTTPLASISDSRPNADVSATYSSVSKRAPSVSRSKVDKARPFASSELSWNTAMCAPTFLAKATTVGCKVQARLPQTLNTRRSPTTGGAAEMGGAACGRTDGPSRIASSRSAQQKARRVIRHAVHRLWHQEVIDLRSRRVGREDGAARGLGRVDRRVGGDPQGDLPPTRRRARRERRLGRRARATGRR